MSSSSAASLISVADMEDVVKMANNLGFTNGAVVNAKDAGMQAAEGVFRIVKLSADTAEVKQVDGNIAHTMTTEELLEKWSVFKGKVTTALHECTADMCSPLLPVDWEIALAKGAVALAMGKHLKLHEEHAFSKLTAYANPSNLRAEQNTT